MPRKKFNPAEGWLHDCKSSTRTWVRTSNTQFDILCGFCRAKIGQWNYTSVEHPTSKNAQFTEAQKNKWK